MHAENGIAIDVLVEQALRPRARPTRATTAIVRPPCWRPRPPTARSSSPGSPGARSTSCTSRPTRRSPRSPRPATWGYNVFAETCPQYLFLSTRQPRAAGLRGRQVRLLDAAAAEEHQAALWRGLRTNDLSVVSTDHCPFCLKGQKELGLGDFSKIPNGIRGVEHRMDLLHQAVVDGHISRRRWIEIACADTGPDVRPLPAEGHDRAGLRRRHRRLRPARDADLSAATHHMNVDYSAYEGKRDHRQGRDRPSRGRVIIDAGRVPRPDGRRQVPAARTPAQYLTGRLHAWTSDSCLQTDPPALAVVDLMLRAERTASATAGPSTRTCSGRSRSSSTADPRTHARGWSSGRW